MDFSYAGHGFDIIGLSKLLERKVAKLFLHKATDMLHFCVSTIALANWILSIVLLSILTLILQENASLIRL